MIRDPMGNVNLLRSKVARPKCRTHITLSPCVASEIASQLAAVTIESRKNFKLLCATEERLAVALIQRRNL
jgi:hypothetical protein